MAEDATRRTRRAVRATAAARRIAEADRMRTVLLATVSHDLRTPLAAAKAAVGCLRSRDVQLTAEDHAELLATAEESLDQLARLTSSLLDVSRLQAGTVPVYPRPGDLGDIIAGSLGDLGPQARAVTVDIPFDLPQVMADPAVMERVIANLAGNALRYSPAGSPLALRASAVAGHVQLRVIDRGPGIPEADRDRAFLPFQRLGDPSRITGVGLGLAVARGLTEAMGGTLEAEETPGGGLTMAISLPAASPAETGPHRPTEHGTDGQANHGLSALRPADQAPSIPGKAQILPNDRWLLRRESIPLPSRVLIAPANTTTATVAFTSPGQAASIERERPESPLILPRPRAAAKKQPLRGRSIMMKECHD